MPTTDQGPSWLTRFSRRATALSLARPGRVAATFLAVLLIGLVGASRLEMRLNYLELLPEEDPAVVDLRWMLAKAGGEGYLVTGIRGGTRQARLGFAEQWVARRAADADFRYAELRYDSEFLRAHASSLLPLATLDELGATLRAAVQKEIERSLELDLGGEATHSASVASELERLIAAHESEIPAEYIEDAAGTELFVLAKPAFESSDLVRAERVLVRLRAEADRALQVEDHRGLEVGFGGSMVFQQAFDQGVRGDLGRMSLWSLVLAALLLLAATRRPLAVLLILAPIVVSISVTLALAAFFVGHLTVISGILVAVLLGLGVEFGLHLVLRTSEAHETLPIEEALRKAGPETMDGAFSGAVTNAAAFAVLLGCTFRAFREFGAIAAVGVLLSWLFTYALLPALILMIERRRPGWVVGSRRAALVPLRVPRWASWALVLIVPGVALFGAINVGSIRFEQSFNALYDSTPDPVGARASTAMNASLTPVVCWVQSLADARRLQALVAEVRSSDPNPRGPSLGPTLSLADLVHDDADERDAALARIGAQLSRIPGDARAQNHLRVEQVERLLAAPRVGLLALPIEFRRRFQALDGDGTLVLLTAARSIDESSELEAYVASVERILDLAKDRGLVTHALSENRIAVRIFRQVFADAPFIGWVSTAVVLLTLFALLRRVRDTALVFLPIALGMLVMFAGLKLGSIKLNFINIAVIPSIFTVAIDNSVHLFHRYRAEGRAAMPLILRHTGLAVLIATCVNAAGYLPALLAGFYGLRTLGWVALFGMSAMLVSTVFWFPALLMTLPEPMPKRRADDAPGDAAQPPRPRVGSLR